MKVELVAFTNVVDDLDEPGWGLWGPEHVCNMAAKTCVSEEIPRISYIDDTYFFWEDEDLKSLKHALDSGHESVAEHASFTFAVSGVSRALTHQLVRHRMASYSQQSQRYVNPIPSDGLFRFVEPTSISRCTTLIDGVSKFPGQANYEYCQLMYLIGRMYNQMIEAGIPEEDARYILPNACTTNIVITMNARELIHFCGLRRCTRAQWEIRELADEMAKLVTKVAPTLGSYMVPKCERTGKCVERKSCGRIKEAEE